MAGQPQIWDLNVAELDTSRRQYICSLLDMLRPGVNLIRTSVGKLFEAVAYQSEQSGLERDGNDSMPATGTRKPKYLKYLKQCLKRWRAVRQTAINGLPPSSEEFQSCLSETVDVFEFGEELRLALMNEEYNTSSLRMDEILMIISDPVFDEYNCALNPANQDAAKQFHLIEFLRLVEGEISVVETCCDAVSRWLALGFCPQDLAKSGNDIISELQPLCALITAKRSQLIPQRDAILQGPASNHDKVRDLLKSDIQNGLVCRSLASACAELCDKLVSFVFDNIHP